MKIVSIDGRQVLEESKEKLKHICFLSQTKQLTAGRM